MTLHQLKVFATVAKLGSVSRAAESFRVHQPSISLLIRSLEQELGVKLFEKLGNKVHLSAPGRRLVDRTDEILARVEGIKYEMAKIKGLAQGEIRVGATTSLIISLPVIVQTFKNKYPGVQVILQVERSRTLEKKLVDGELDLAVVGQRPASRLLISEPYREQDFVAIARPNHPLVKKRFVTLALLVKEPLITHGKGALLRDKLEETFLQRGLPFQPMIEFTPQLGAKDAIRSAVLSGLGIGFLTKCHVAQDVEAGRLKVLNVPEIKLKRQSFITVPKNRKRSPFVKAFIELLKKDRKT